MNDLNLTISILSYNTSDITDKCLTHLKASVDFAQRKLKNEIRVVVLDNASLDDSVKEIKKNHSWVKLIECRENLGFGKGHNIVMAKSNSPFILLLNSDTFVEEDTLFQSLKFMQDHPEVDAMGCKLIYSDGVLQPSAGYLPNFLNTFFWISGLAAFPIINNFTKPIHPKNNGFFSKQRQVEWLMGAFFLMRKKVYTQTNGFDEKIFMYGEDIEIGMRMKKLGFKLSYNPDFKITHLERASSNFNLEKPLYNEIKALVYFYHKFYPNLYFPIKLVLAFFLVLRGVIFFTLGKYQRTKAYFGALRVL